MSRATLMNLDRLPTDSALILHSDSALIIRILAIRIASRHHRWFIYIYKECKSPPTSLACFSLLKLFLISRSGRKDGLVHLGQSLCSCFELVRQLSLPFLLLLHQHTSHPVLVGVLVFVELSMWNRGQELLDAEFAGHLEKVCGSSQ